MSTEVNRISPEVNRTSADVNRISTEANESEIVEEELDPRVQEELEKLNVYTEEINQIELQLEDANCFFRTLLSDSTHLLKDLSKRLGGCIEKARPYYEALEVYHRAQAECQSAATHYQRASGIHMAAKETITLAEQRFLSNSTSWDFDNAWQEMLNHATIKVMEAEKQKTESESEHLHKAAFFQHAEAEVHRLERKLTKFVLKSQPYFEQKDVFNKALSAQKALVEGLQEKVVRRKSMYAQSLRNLEEISESIHEQRRLKRPREPGVGAERERNCQPCPDKSRLESSLSYDLDKVSRVESSLSYDLDRCDGASSCRTNSLDKYDSGTGSLMDRYDRASCRTDSLDRLDGVSYRTDSSVSFRQDSSDLSEFEGFGHRRQMSDQVSDVSSVNEYQSDNKGLLYAVNDMYEGLGDDSCEKDAESAETESKESLPELLMKKLRISWRGRSARSLDFPDEAGNNDAPNKDDKTRELVPRVLPDSSFVVGCSSNAEDAVTNSVVHPKNLENCDKSPSVPSGSGISNQNFVSDVLEEETQETSNDLTVHSLTDGEDFSETIEL